MPDALPPAQRSYYQAGKKWSGCFHCQYIWMLRLFLPNEALRDHADSEFHRIYEEL